jgi:BirA family transcriptional regulator, biotin operon repressor / biotin---[acetyl-CoA-carboxylase] ligase
VSPEFVRVERHARLSSTNTHLAALAREGAPPFTAVLAREQNRGRGRGGKGWHSPPDAGLWISVLLPAPPAGVPGVASLAVGVATSLAVEAVAAIQVGLKWPNDLFVMGNSPLPEFGKVAGILCESVATGDGGKVVAGIGVNLRRPASVPDEMGEAAFLEDAAGRRIDADRLVEALGRELRRWADPPPDEVEDALRMQWDRRDLLAGRRIAAEAGVAGIARGLDRTGALLVSDEGGRRHRITGGTVRLVGRGSPALFVAEAP